MTVLVDVAVSVLVPVGVQVDDVTGMVVTIEVEDDVHVTGLVVVVMIVVRVEVEEASVLVVVAVAASVLVVAGKVMAIAGLLQHQHGEQGPGAPPSTKRYSKPSEKKVSFRTHQSVSCWSPT